MIPVLAIPTYNRADLLTGCIASIDYPVENLVIIDNSDGHRQRDQITLALSRKTPAVKIHRIEHPNVGVAGSWNEAIKLFPAAWWMLVNDDITFASGDLEKMAKAIESPKVKPPCCYLGNHGASWWAVTSDGYDKVGSFDENFFPAYLEDLDWNYRASLLGLAGYTVPDCHALHGGSSTINLSRDVFQANSASHQVNREYYGRKWGCPGSDLSPEIFTTPFNDPQWPIWAWKFEPKLREKQQWHWEAITQASGICARLK